MPAPSARSGDARPDVPRRHDGVSMTLHWATLALFAALFATAWWRERAGDGATAAAWLEAHRSLGTLVWGLTLARLAWKRLGARTPPLPATMPRHQRVAARANEAALLALLASQPLTGFAQSVWRGKAFALFGLDVPALAARDRGLVHVFGTLHQAGATLLLALVALHALAAVFHHVVLRDDVLRAMWPGSLVVASPRLGVTPRDATPGRE